ncbi:MAG: hypothetical protein AAFX76_07460 [Planctomycetota bacterium]
MTPAANPFRSARVDALDYTPVGEYGWPALTRRLRETRFRGAIVGPHGHGKTTLLQRLDGHVERPAGDSLYLQVHPDNAARHADVRQAIRDHAGLLKIDGYDLLGPRDRWAVCRRRRPVLVTSHRRTPLPTVVRCHTMPALIGGLIARLSSGVRERMTEREIVDLHTRHRGNVREAFRELYDRAADGEFL